MAAPLTAMELAVQSAVERALKPVLEKLKAAEGKIAELQGVDLKTDARLAGHSGQHRLTLNAITEVKEVSNRDLLAVATASATAVALVDAKVNDLNSRLQFVPKQAGAAADAAIDAKTAVDKGQISSRNRTIALLLALVISTVINHLK